LAILAVAVGALVVTARASQVRPTERLFLGVQIERDGAVVASPRLLGETGKLVTVRYVDPEDPEKARVALQLKPERDGAGYRVEVRLSLPGLGEQSQGELLLAHGEEREVRLPPAAAPITVRLLLMRVDSPEFGAFLKLGQAEPRPSCSRAAVERVRRAG